MLKLSYLNKNSFLHDLDSLNKFFWVIGIAFLSYIITNPLHQFILFLGITSVIFAMGRITFKEFLGGMLLFVTFGLILFIMQALFYVGPDSIILISFGPVSIKLKALMYGLNLALRVFVIGSSALCFVLTTEPRRMIYDMVARLHLPYRFAFAFYTAIRFIPIFETEAYNILNAHMIRGSGEIEKGLSGKLKVYKRLGVPLLISGLRKAKMAAIAMDSRAFGAYTKRTLTYTYNTPGVGYLFSIIPWIIFVFYLHWIIAYGLWQIS